MTLPGNQTYFRFVALLVRHSLFDNSQFLMGLLSLVAKNTGTKKSESTPNLSKNCLTTSYGPFART